MKEIIDNMYIGLSDGKYILYIYINAKDNDNVEIILSEEQFNKLNEKGLLEENKHQFSTFWNIFDTNK